jgi:hypothetical protein
MTKFNVKDILAGAATAVALTMAASGGALAAHGGGIGPYVSGGIGHNTTTVSKIETTKWRHFDHERFERDRRRFRIREFGLVDAGVAPYCVYKLTPLGRVRVCPEIAY